MGFSKYTRDKHERRKTTLVNGREWEDARGSFDVGVRVQILSKKLSKLGCMVAEVIGVGTVEYVNYNGQIVVITNGGEEPSTSILPWWRLKVVDA